MDENPEAVKKIMTVLIKADPQWMGEEIHKVKKAVKEGYYISRSFKNRAGPSLLQSGDITNLDSANQRLLFAGMLANNPHLLKETTDEMWQVDPDTMAEALDIIDSDGSDRKRMDHNPDALLFIAGKMLDKNPYVLERVISERHGFKLTILLAPLALIVMIFIMVKVVYHNPKESIAARKEKERRQRQKEKQKKKQERKRLVVELPGSKPKKKKKAVPKADSANKVVNQKKWKKKTKSVQPIVFVPEEVKLRKLWMDSINRVHEEAESTFKEIRQRIEAENLKRTAPKEKKPSRKSKLSDQTENTFLATDIGGKKAGKSQFIINVGATEHLYKTTKLSAGSKQSSTKMPFVDLHGMSKAEALDMLNKRLPKWVDTANRGVYPWVIQVKIICGGGNQILSEAVAAWIREKKQVSNAPQSG